MGIVVAVIAVVVVELVVVVEVVGGAACHGNGGNWLARGVTGKYLHLQDFPLIIAQLPIIQQPMSSFQGGCATQFLILHFCHNSLAAIVIILPHPPFLGFDRRRWPCTQCRSNILICTTDPWQFSICSHQLVIQYVLISVIFCNLLGMIISPIHWKLWQFFLWNKADKFTNFVIVRNFLLGEQYVKN